MAENGFKVESNGHHMEHVMRSNLRQRVMQIVFDCTAIVLIYTAFALVWLYMKPHVRYLTCAETFDVSYPFLINTINFRWVVIFGTSIPIICILLVEFANAKLIPARNRHNQDSSQKEKLRLFGICAFHAISLFVLGTGINLLITDVGKRWVGRLRPYFLDMCKPNLQNISCTSLVNPGIALSFYTGDGFCSNTNIKQINQARFSFPSGHSSYACYCMVFLIIYLEARFFTIRYRYFKTILQITAFLLAFSVCLSRIPDYHHRGSDVAGGAALGTAVAFFVTYFVGKVLWEFNVKPNKYYDYDLRDVRRVDANI